MTLLLEIWKQTKRLSLEYDLRVILNTMILCIVSSKHVSRSLLNHFVRVTFLHGELTHHVIIFDKIDVDKFASDNQCLGVGCAIFNFDMYMNLFSSIWQCTSIAPVILE
jgi:hypothetical protein